jgi:polyisoprenyl-phosphate glycosyltransferase
MLMDKISPHLSVISPVYQAEDVVDELVNRLTANLNQLTDKFEIILVEDGSRDLGWEKIKKYCNADSRIKGIQLSRNFGQHSAITAGIEASSGEWVVVMDCDLQDRPEEIAALYRKAQEGYDIVLASRRERKDEKQQQLFSKLFYYGLSFLTGVKHDNSIANFGIYHRRVVNSIMSMQESIRFFPAMVNWVGFKRVNLSVEHSERFQGKSSYNFKKKFKLAIDIILAYSDKPLKMIIALGLIISLSAFLFALVIAIKALQGKIAVLGYASLIITVSFFSGIIISVLGIIGLYVGKIFDGIKDRPIYLIKEKIND